MTAIRIISADFDDPAHAEAIVEIVNAYAIEPQGGGKPLSGEVRRSIVPGMKATPGAFTFLAWEGDRPVGVAVCFRGFSTFSGGPLVNVHDLSVLASHRGRGIGSRLLEAVEEYAREQGCCKVTLEVREANPHAERLYRRLGYSDPAGFPTRFLDKPL
jgi:GNAT superfamily N-acetyltransferase